MRLLAMLATLLFGATALAQTHAGVDVADPWSRALPPVVSTGAAYVVLTNRGHHTDRLVSVSSTISGQVEVHGHRMDGGVAKMHRVDALELPPGKSITFEPGGLHLMLVDLKKPLVEGESFGLTLRFQHGGEARVTVPVLAATASGGHAGHGMQQGAMSHGTAGHGEHAQGHDHDHGMHGAPVEMPAAEAPTVAVRVMPDPAGGFNVHVTTQRFRFAPEHVNGEHVPGEGHAHLYVDGNKVARLYGPWHHIAALAPGKRHIAVSLHANAHAHYAVDGRLVMAQVEVVVPAP